MARVIVRFSLNSDPTSAVRNNVANTLQQAGLQNTGTGTWEGNAPATQIAAGLQSAIAALTAPQNVPGANPAAKLDHLWIYVDGV